MQQQSQISEQISKIHLTSPPSWLEVWKASRLALISDLESIPGIKSQTERSLPVIRDTPRESHTPKIRDDGTCRLYWRFLMLHVSGQLRRRSSKYTPDSSDAGQDGHAAAFVPPHAPLRVRTVRAGNLPVSVGCFGTRTDGHLHTSTRTSLTFTEYERCAVMICPGLRSVQSHTRKTLCLCFKIHHQMAPMLFVL